MFVPFNELPENASVWVYPLSRNLSQAESQAIMAQLIDFVAQWQAHGHPLKASATILLNRFIVLAADEAHYAPSGCAIDRSVQAVRQLVNHFGLEIADRGQVFFFINNTINPVPVNQLKQAHHQGLWNANTLVFDTTAPNVSALQRNPVPAHSTWLVRYLQQVSV